MPIYNELNFKDPFENYNPERLRLSEFNVQNEIAKFENSFFELKLPVKNGKIVSNNKEQVEIQPQ